MQANTYLFFSGRCEEAFKFYEKALGAKILVMMPHRGTPAEGSVPADWKDKIIHGRLQIGNTLVMASDGPADRVNPAGGFAICLRAATTDEAEHLYNALKEGGTINMPLEETFFAHRFAMLNDQFGTPWMIICEKQM